MSDWRPGSCSHTHLPDVWADVSGAVDVHRDAGDAELAAAEEEGGREEEQRLAAPAVGQAGLDSRRDVPRSLACLPPSE